jgi:RNA polymerase sigma-70 factor (ECF subfamily)
MSSESVALTEAISEPRVRALSFDAIYEAHVAFVWRNLRRFGLYESELPDATQDTFVVVHRRLPELAELSSLRAWIFSILRRVAARYRRVRRPGEELNPEQHSLATGPSLGPEQDAERAEALRWMLSLLEELDEEKRSVFVLAELEEMTAPEIAKALDCNVNTVYSRLRVARERLRIAFERDRQRRQR